MSRSYKKHPYVTDNSSSGVNKRIANRTFRRNKTKLYQGGNYKKAYCSYNICDYRWRWTEQDAIEYYYSIPPDCYLRRKYPTLDSYLEYQKKCCVRK